MAIKLDMSEAYDRIKWTFLQAVMAKMGFNHRWIQLVKKCVTSITYTILINDQPQQPFNPSRGLRQGDPLSPYLFILCSKALSCLLSKAKSSRRISSLSISKGPFRLNHLFFADDSLFFICKTISIQWSNLVSLLDTYEYNLGQLINKEKSSIFFSPYTPKNVQGTIIKSLKTLVRHNGLTTFVMSYND